jgi:hypothetical protein
LPKLGDNLFSLVTLPCHRGLSWLSKTYLKSDHFSGGGSEFASLGQSTLEFAKLVRDGTSNVSLPSPEVRSEGGFDD